MSVKSMVPISFIISLLYSTEEAAMPMGGHMHVCRRCEQLQPHLLLQAIKRDTGIIRTRNEIPLYKLSQCEVCSESVRHHKDSVPHFIERWEPNSNLQDFAFRSGFELDSKHNLLTPKSARALLESVTSKTAVAINLTWKNYLSVFLIVVLCGFIGAILFSKTDNVEEGMLLLVGPPIAGIIFSLFFLIYLQNRRKVKDDHVIEFRNRIQRLGLTPKSVVDAMPQSALTNQKIYTLIRSSM